MFDFFIAEAPLMPVIGKRLGVVLGPRGKMPKPLPPGADPTPVIISLRNTVRVRSRDKKTFHAPIGTRDMPPEDSAEYDAFRVKNPAEFDAVKEWLDAELKKAKGG